MSKSEAGQPDDAPAGDRGAESPWARPDSNAWVPPTAAPPAAASRSSDAPAAPARGLAALVVVIAFTVVTLGVVVVVVLAIAGVFDSGRHSATATSPSPLGSTPKLAKLCPAPSGSVTEQPHQPGPVAPMPAGDRLADEQAGISYAELGDPFHRWDLGTWDSGELGVKFGTGYYVVTEQYSGGDYLASVLSGSVPATVGDSLTLNLRCAGKQVSQDVRNAYYPQPNQKQDMRNEYTTVGGRPAWVSEFHLSFSQPDLHAHGETVAVVTVDVGRPKAAVLYISIPDTHAQYDAQIDPIIDSIRKTS